MSIPEVTRINRSLTKGELALQLAMNKILGGDARILAKALTENLTNIRNEKIIPSAEGQQILRDRLEPYIRQANLHLPKGHEIIFDQQEPAPHISGEYLFSEAQLEVIGTILAEEIRNLRYPCHPPSTVPPSILRQLWGKMKCRIFP